MAHIKVVPGDSFGFDEPLAVEIKVGSRGLRGADKQLFIKRAGHELAERIAKLAIEPGEIPIHLLGVGSTEYYSCNRNGDGFKVACCKKYHPTFVKYARFYRGHINKDKAKSYGIIKESFYNDTMHRIELIACLNGTKEAAQRNGGLLADKELEKLASGKEIGVSMAARVPVDVCSYCNNKAPSRDQYCTEDTCGGGGLKHNITAVLKCGHVLHADNPDPTFFDMSHVVRPADRTAYVFGQIEKAASAKLMGSELAELYGIHDPFNNEPPSKVAGLLTLAQIIASQPVESNLALAYAPEVINEADWTLPPTVKAAEALSALQVAYCLPSLFGFLAITLGNVKEAQHILPEVIAALPGSYRLLTANPTLLGTLVETYQQPTSLSSPARRWATKLAEYCSLDPAALRRRVAAATLRGAQPPQLLGKQANSAISSAAQFVANAFTAYKIALFDTASKSRQDQTLSYKVAAAQILADQLH